MARSAGVGLSVERDRIPVLPGVLEACEFFDIDPWTSISEGTLLLTVRPGSIENVLDVLDAEGILAADVGEVVKVQGVEVDGEQIDRPGVNPFWGAFEVYMGKLEDAS